MGYLFAGWKGPMADLGISQPIAGVVYVPSEGVNVTSVCCERAVQALSK